MSFIDVTTSPPLGLIFVFYLRSVGDILEKPLKFIKHDNVDIRKNGLLLLRSLLNDNHDAMVRDLIRENGTNAAVAKVCLRSEIESENHFLGNLKILFF